MLMATPTIPENWRDNAFTILEAGRVVNAQRAALSQEDFDIWLKLQPVGDESTARKIGQIARHPILGNPANTAKLPPKWGKLYEASFLPDVFLKEKINNGGIDRLSKYDIWRIRGRTNPRDDTPLAKSPHRPPPSNRRRNNPGRGGPRLIVPPPYAKVSDWVRAGLEIEKRSEANFRDAAKAIGMKRDTYQRGRVVVLLHDRTDLNLEDRKLIATTVAEMDYNRTVFTAYNAVRPIAAKIWGAKPGTGRRRNYIGKKVEEKRKEAFVRAVTVICDTCDSVVDIEIPFVGKEEAASAIGRILRARQALGQLVKRIRGSGQ